MPALPGSLKESDERDVDISDEVEEFSGGANQAVRSVPRLRGYFNSSSNFSRTSSFIASAQTLPLSGRTPRSRQGQPFESSASLRDFGGIGGGAYMSPRVVQEFISEHGVEKFVAQFRIDEADQANQKRAAVKLKHSKLADFWQFARRPAFGLPKALWIGIMGMLPLVIGLLISGFGVDVAMHIYAGEWFSIMDMLWTLAFPDMNQGREVAGNVLNSVSVIFGLLMTMITFVVQMAASRFTDHVTHLFFRDKFILGSLISAIFSMILSLWIILEISPYYVPRFTVWLLLILVTVQLLFLFPFLGYLFWFLEPDKVVTKIIDNGLDAVGDSINGGGDTSRNQVRVAMTVENLIDAANSALEHRDKDITALIVNAMVQFAIMYGNFKESLALQSPGWFDIPDWIRQSPDFLTVPAEQLSRLQDDRVWLEWKLLQNFKTIFNAAVKNMKETCYHVAINTQILGDIAARRKDFHTVELCLKLFNTYLRIGINNDDIRTIYNCLYQYRLLAETLLQQAANLQQQAAADSVDASGVLEHERWAVKVAKYMRYYGSIFVARPNLIFLVEVVAQDVRGICEKAFYLDSPVHDALLNVFLTMYDGSEDGGKVNRGTRKAQIILASTYLVADPKDKAEYAHKIFKEFEGETPEMLYELEQKLLLTSKYFWEVTERGININYLDDDQKEQMTKFFNWFPEYEEKRIQIEKDKTGKVYMRKKQIENFD